ncbi:MAG: glycosyltransferase family 2 protein [Planctomycetota bacterium]|jgi:glycosyltransferase involved in cell wall biosynthesis
MAQQPIVAVVPALNEEPTIRQVVRSLLDLPLGLEVVVVDDASDDDTAGVAREAGAVVLRLPANLGIGGAVQTGLRYALARGARAAVQVDGDGQHPAESLESLVRPILEDEADVVIGSRFLTEGGYRSSVPRRAGIGVLSTALRLLTGKRFSDPTSGYRAMGRRVIELFAEDYPEDYPEPEALLVLVRKLGARIVEVPVEMRPRQGGRSSIRGPISLFYMAKVLTAVLVGRFR